VSAGEAPLASECAANFARDALAPAVQAQRRRFRGRLNLFQTAMLRWRDLHPYNAVHVARVRIPFERGRIETAITGQLGAAGLTGFVLDRAHRRYEYRGGPATFELDVLAAGDDADATIRAEIERQLNRPFPADGAFTPFRFFVRDDGDEFRLGLAYDHFVAGGDSIVALLNDIVLGYSGVAVDHAKPDLYPATFRPMFVRNAGALLRRLSALSRVAANCRRSIRPRYRNHADGANGFEFVTLPAPAAGALRAKAKALGVTFNDLTVAIILKAVARHCEGKRHSGRRREIAVASVVNLRRECGFGEREVFGQFLSSMRISHSVPDAASLESLAQDVHRETARFKKEKLYLQMLLAMRINGIVWWFLDAEQRQRLYAKAYPVMAGLTSLNVDALWQAREPSGESGDYLRAVPTGPLAPLVVATTTSGNALAFGLSYRRTAFTAPEIVKIAGFIAASVRSLQ
jgi:NRPS condensation-like uncharacterized protein